MNGLAPARVRVPCSTSNLGSGYDTIGLALDRYLDAVFEPNESGSLSVEHHGTLVGLRRGVSPDLTALMFEREARRLGNVPSGWLRLTSEVPVARGLGTSAAALLAGFDLARAASGMPPDDRAAFEAALRVEGHGDNLAPCVWGGLRAVVATAEGPVVMPLDLSDRVGFAYAAPAAGVTTKEARGLLPRHVPHGVAVAALGRIMALIRGLAEANPDLLRIGVDDELHLPFRLPLIPHVTSAISAGVDAGAWAVTVSGAGSGLIAMCDPADAVTVAAAMRAMFDAEEGDPGCVGFALRPDRHGMRRITTS